MRITGWISSDEVRAEILAARALVLPSFAEGLPVVIMEAMALRRPVVTTFVAGIPELIRNGEHGRLVPAGDLESLAAAMEECLATAPEAITRIGESARQRVLQRHDVDKEAAKLARTDRAYTGRLDRQLSAVPVTPCLMLPGSEMRTLISLLAVVTVIGSMQPAVGQVNMQ